MTLVLEQLLNGLQFGVMLFLLAAGLTLIFGIMGVINLAHGSLYMIGAYRLPLSRSRRMTGSFMASAIVASLAAAAAGRAHWSMELFVMQAGSMAAIISTRCWRPSR